MFTNVGRWPKLVSCMQLPRANQATKSSCSGPSGPTGRNSLFYMFYQPTTEIALNSNRRNTITLLLSKASGIY